VLAVAIAMAVTGCGTPGTGANGPGPTASAANPTDAATFPTTVDGLTVMSVSELLAARKAGSASGGPYALRGYWSTPMMGHSCPAPNPDGGPLGDLEMYCQDGLFGITELDELAVQVRRSANELRVLPPEGPFIVPFLDQALYQRLLMEPVGAQLHAPVPIVVTGHFDDPRAAACRPEARQGCLDRFVLDRVVDFDPGSVPDPTATPVPSRFPFDSPPPAPFVPARCSASGIGAAGPFSFVGWMPGEQIPGSMGVDYSGVTLFVAITRDAVPLGEWSDTSPRWRPMGRMICVGREGETDAVQFDSVRGSTYRQFEDGSTAPPLP